MSAAKVFKPRAVSDVYQSRPADGVVGTVPSASSSGEVIVSPYRERYMKCASCRSDARYAVARADTPTKFTTSCERHLDLWRRRKSDEGVEVIR